MRKAMQAKVATTALAAPVVEEVVHFDFYGDRLDVARTPDGEHWVVLAKLCEHFELKDAWEQARKLRKLEWAQTGKFTVWEDGLRREVFCINIRSVAGWLFTINVGNVAEHLREKLTVYQQQCADRLADHFLGKRSPHQNAMVTADQFALVLGEIRAVRAENQDIRAENKVIRAANEVMAANIVEIRAENGALKGHILRLLQSGGTISGMQVDIIRMEVKQLAYMRVALKKNKNTKSARMSVENLINAAAQWGGRGQRRCNMPADRWPNVQTCIATHRSDLESDLKRNGDMEKQILEAVRGEQQVLFKKSDAN